MATKPEYQYTREEQIMTNPPLLFCENCWTPSSRPRITFHYEDRKNCSGKIICNACGWANEKKQIDWKAREARFVEIAERQKVLQKLWQEGGETTPYDVIVPWSGGKDSIYVAERMQELGLSPLLVTVLPHLELPIGKWNRQNMCHNVPHLEIKLKDDKYRKLAKKYFIEDGRPKHPWECAISAVIINQAAKLKVPLIVYGEEGEAEYGGISREAERWDKPVDKEYLMKYYYQDGKLDWDMPSDEDFDNIFFTQWSRFENWNPSYHAHFSVLKGMHTEPVRNIGTFTGTAQLSDKLQDLHAYLMFLKFGFGRCTSDVSIAIRDNWTNREEGLTWIEAYDGEFPEKYLKDYLKYFSMTKREFGKTLAKHVNTTLLDRVGDVIWRLKPEIKQYRREQL